jgi:hypothetical protein
MTGFTMKRECSISDLQTKWDVIVVGGGLAGILCTRRLGEKGCRVLLVDQGLPEAHGKLGGFAPFSGAKFSPPPAGMGLASPAGSVADLKEAAGQVIETLGLASRQHTPEASARSEIMLDPSTRYRGYASIVLTTEEMGLVLNRISRFPVGVSVCHVACTRITKAGDRWEVHLLEVNGQRAKVLKCDAVFFAGGRSGSYLLEKTGVTQHERKGIDVGVRIEVVDRGCFAELRKLGPDPKILFHACRTFCLNCPGEMYMYPHGDIMIAGGLAADEACQRANVGLLVRTAGKRERLLKIARSIRDLRCAGRFIYKQEVAENGLGCSLSAVSEVLGNDIAVAIDAFKLQLASLGLAQWRDVHFVHLPLMDWYWPTFGVEERFESEMKRLFIIGDAAGHARGLLQAAISGWLAAAEYLR